MMATTATIKITSPFNNINQSLSASSLRSSLVKQYRNVTGYFGTASKSIREPPLSTVSACSSTSVSPLSRAKRISQEADDFRVSSSSSIHLSFKPTCRAFSSKSANNNHYYSHARFSNDMKLLPHCRCASSMSASTQHKKAAAALKFKSSNNNNAFLGSQKQQQSEIEEDEKGPISTTNISKTTEDKITSATNNGVDDGIQQQREVRRLVGDEPIDKRQQQGALRPHHFRLHEFAPRIVVVGIGGAGCNALNNMISSRQLSGVEFLALNTDAQHLSVALAENRVQLGSNAALDDDNPMILTGLGCGANPDAGRAAAEESRDAIANALDIQNTNMVFLTAGMGGGTGTGATPVVAELCYNAGILTVAVVTKPFFFEGRHRMRLAMEGLNNLRPVVDSLLVVPNQNLFQVANESTTFIDSFKLADDVLLAGVKGITDLMISPGLINLDFADVQSVMHGMGNAILGTGQAEGENRAIRAAEAALQNPLLLGEMDISTAKGLLVNITGGADMTLFEVDKAAQRITQVIKDENANIIFGSAFDASLSGSIKVSIVATGLDESTPSTSANNGSPNE